MSDSAKPDRYSGRDLQIERLIEALIKSGRYFNGPGQLDLERLVADARALQAAIKDKLQGGAKP
jgi:hypothetical protein